ncbi:MAG: hypothetical protein H6682_11295 [Candidatus Eisenbacteria bacterium]|nr:hypothetical protein [Candidatus Eisenbacteria bacterium]
MTTWKSPLIAWGILGALLTPTGVCAQYEDLRVTFEELRAPSSPAFILLGATPTQVDRPQDLSDLAISLSSASQDLSLIPKAYSVEFAPYWLASRPKVHFSDWAGGARGGQFFQDMTISLATITKSVPDTTSTETIAGLGIRTSLLRAPVTQEFQNAVHSDLSVLRSHAISINSELRAARERLQDHVLAGIRRAYEHAQGEPTSESLFNELSRIMAKVGDQASDEMLAAWDRYAGAFTSGADPMTQIAPALDELVALADQATPELEYEEASVDSLLSVLAVGGDLRVDGVPPRRGMQIDIAGAVSWKFQDQVAKVGELEAAAGWLSIAYQAEPVELAAVTRVTGTKDGRPAYDIGISVAPGNWHKIAPSLEGIVRSQSGSAPDYRYTLILESAMKGGKNVVFSLGRDFEPDLKGSLIATLQFVVGLGQERVLDTIQ